MNPMSNKTIAAQFELLAQLLEISGENPFKTKSYSIAAFRIGKLSENLAELSEEQIRKLENIGPAVAAKIFELTSTGKMQALEELLAATPPGIIELLHIKGLGAKKIRQLWLELEIESVGELAYAAQENRLITLKGFGKKTQEQILQQIEFYQTSKGKFLLAQVLDTVEEMVERLREHFPENTIKIIGDIARRNNVVEHIELATNISQKSLQGFFEQITEGIIVESEEKLVVDVAGLSNITFWNLPGSGQGEFLLRANSSPEFAALFQQEFGIATADTEEEIFKNAGVPYLPPERREAFNFNYFQGSKFSKQIENRDIRGLIHSHSTWSDGVHSIRQMAEACIQIGYEYMVITDHSVSAFYANGLSADRVLAQHTEIDELNKELAPFKIFKGIEADILHSGAIDYNEDMWKKFDLIIASVHANLRMDQTTATARVLKALDNPYVRILGHPTGRLLLSRPGYPLDFEAVLKKCADRNIAVELNANPRRLDLDVSMINRALELGVKISINPDAHSTEGIAHNRFGVLSASKSMLDADNNISSFSLPQFQQFLMKTT